MPQVFGEPCGVPGAQSGTEDTMMSEQHRAPASPHFAPWEDKASIALRLQGPFFAHLGLGLFKWKIPLFTAYWKEPDHLTIKLNIW